MSFDIKTDPGRRLPPSARQGPTPEQRVAGDAVRKGLTVRVPGGDGATVELSGRELLALAARADHPRLAELGVDRATFFSTLAERVGDAEPGSIVDLTTPAPPVSGPRDRDQMAAGRAPERPTQVTTGVEGGFVVSGEAVEAPEHSFWAKLLDFLKEVFTLSFADTRTFNGRIDADRWQQHGRSVGVIGGSALKAELEQLGPEGAKARLGELVRGQNPDLSKAVVERTVEALHAGLSELYASGVTDAQLDALQRVYMEVGTAGFGGDVGRWLDTEVSTDAQLVAALAGAQSPAAASALLSLANAEFAEMAPPIQGELSRQVFETRTDAESVGAYRALIAGGELAGLPADARRALLKAIRNAGPGARGAQAARTVAQQLHGRLGDASVRGAVVEALGSVGEGQHAELVALGNLFGSDAFGELAPDVRRAIAAQAATTDAAGVGDCQRLIEVTGFGELAVDVQRAALTSLQAARGAEARTAVISMAGSESFRGLADGSRRAALSAAAVAVDDGARANLQGLLATRGFGALPGPRQVAVLERFSSGGPAVQRSYDRLAPVIDRLAGVELDAAVEDRMLDEMLTAPPGQAARRADALVELATAMSDASLSPAEQGHVLDAARASEYDPERTALLAELLGDASYRDLAPGVRTGVLERLVRVNDASLRRAVADPRALVDLARDDDLGRLAPADQRRVLEVADRRSVDYLRQVRYLIGKGGFRRGDDATRGKLLDIATARSTSFEQLVAIGKLVDDSAFGALDPGAQATLLDHVLAHPGQLDAVAQLLAHRDQVGDVPDAAFVAALTRVDAGDSEAVAGFGAFVAAAAGAEPAVRAQIFSLADHEQGPARMAMATQVLGNRWVTDLSADEKKDLLAWAARHPDQSAVVEPLLNQFQWLFANERQPYIDLLAKVDLSQDDQRRAIGELGPRLKDLSPPVRKLVFDAITDAATLAAVNARTGRSDFSGLSQDEKLAAIMEVQARSLGAGDATLRSAWTGLLDDPLFKSLPVRERKGILSLGMHYGDATTVQRLRSTLSASWFRTMSADDQLRSIRVISLLAHQSHRARNASQRDVLVNTLDHFLPPDGKVRMEFKEYDDAEGSLTYGSARGRTFWINRALIDANDTPIEKISNRRDRRRAEHVARNTMAHEVNHLVNDDRVRESYDYFQGEYRAWYVGFIAENGRPPTRREAYARCKYLLNPGDKDGAYARIQAAREDIDGSWYLLWLDDNVGDQAKLIIRFMNQFTAAPVSEDALDSRHTIIQFGEAGKPTLSNPGQPAPLPDPLRDITNGGSVGSGRGHEHEHFIRAHETEG